MLNRALLLSALVLLTSCHGEIRIPDPCKLDPRLCATPEPTPEPTPIVYCDRDRTCQCWTCVDTEADRRKIGAPSARCMQGVYIACPTQTPTPEPTPEGTPTASPTATPTAAPGKPDVCPCSVIWSTTIHTSVDEGHNVVPSPVAGGWTTIDSTLSFSRWPGDGRGIPCDTPEREAEVCGTRKCEPARGPDWSVTAPGGVPQHEDGFQLRLGPLKRGSYRVQVLFPSNLHDQEEPWRAITRCPWAPGPTRSDVVEFEVE